MQHVRNMKPSISPAKRGAKPAKVIAFPLRSLFAPLVSVEDANLLRARLLDPSVNLTMDERAHIARDWRPKREQRGRPPLPAIIARSNSLAVARFFIWAAYAGRRLGDESEVKRAKGKTAIECETCCPCNKRTVEAHLAVAKKFMDGEWWPNACRLARKNKKEKLMDY
jgi:hypothetical protein